MTESSKIRAVGISRRDAIKIGAGAGAAGLLLGATGTAIAEESAGKVPSFALTGPGHVVKVHKEGMKTGRFPDAAAAKEMVDKAVTTLAGKSDIAKAWGMFLKKDDRVGIKINVLGGKLAGTSKEVVDAIVEGILAFGVPEKNIMIFDQFGGNMRGARYQWQDKPGKMRVINHEVLGYESEYTKTEGGGKGKLAKTLTWSTAIISVPVIKDHDLAGITCAMKNMVFGCVERPPMMHTAINTAMPHFYAHEAIRGRVRIIIADGSFCLYDGGPKNNPKANVPHDCVYATTDPVAMDVICAEVVENYRAEHKMRTLAQVRRPVSYPPLAQKIGLGIADRDRIKLQEIELSPVKQKS